MSQEKIKPVGENPHDSNPAFSNEEVGGAKKDLSKAGIIISVLAVFLLIIFYYAQNKNMDALSSEVGKITETRLMVQELDSRMDQMDRRIAAVENLPETVRGMVLGGMIAEMAQKAGYIGGYVSDEQQAKLNRVRSLLREIQNELDAK